MLTLRPSALLALICVAGCQRPGGRLRVDWTFGGQACDRAGVSTVRLAVTGMAPHLFPCRNGRGEAAATVEGVPPGIHSIDLKALSLGGKLLYEGDHGAIELVDDFTTAVRVDLGRALAPGRPKASPLP